MTTLHQSIVASNRPRPQASDPSSRLFNRNFVLLWQGLAVSQLGSQIYSIAITFWIKEATESASLLGFMMMASSLPGAVLGLVSGALSDRYSRRAIILFADMVRGALTLSLAASLWIYPERTSVIIAWMLVVGVGNAMCGSLFGPAVSAAIPDLVPGARVATANSLRQMTLQVVQFGGRALAGILFTLLGAPVLTFFNGLSFLISALAVYFVRIPRTQTKGNDSRQGFRQLGTEIMTGFGYVRRVPGLTQVFVVSSLLSFLTMPVIVLLPFYVEDWLKLSLDWYGYVLAIYGAGAFAGSAAAGLVRLSANRRAPVLLSIAILYCLCVTLLGIVSNLLGALSLAFIIGALGAFNGVSYMTLLQLTTPSHLRGRVFGLLATLSSSLAPLGMGLGGVVFDVTGKNIPLMYVSCGTLMTVLCLCVCLNREFRRFLKSDVGSVSN